MDRQKKYKTYFTNMDTLPLSLLHTTHGKEYFEFEVYAEEVPSVDVETEENSHTHPCHLCDTDVPISHLDEHNKSDIHIMLKTIADTALERARKQMALVAPTVRRPSASTYYCSSCSKSVAVSNRAAHENSSEHTHSMIRLKILQTFLSNYRNNEKISEIDTKNEDRIEQIVDDTPSEIQPVMKHVEEPSTTQLNKANEPNDDEFIEDGDNDGGNKTSDIHDSLQMINNFKAIGSIKLRKENEPNHDKIIDESSNADENSNDIQQMIEDFEVPHSMKHEIFEPNLIAIVEESGKDRDENISNEQQMMKNLESNLKIEKAFKKNLDEIIEVSDDDDNEETRLVDFDVGFDLNSNEKTDFQAYLTVIKDLGVNNITYVDENFLEIKTLSGGVVKVLTNHFHSYECVGNITKCNVCDKVVGDTREHEFNIVHMRRIMTTIKDIHSIREINQSLSVCIICNEIVKDAAHVLHQKHSNLLKKAIIKDDGISDQDLEKLPIEDNMCGVDINKSIITENIIKDEYRSDKTQSKPEKVNVIIDNYCIVCDKFILNTDKQNLKQHKSSLKHRLNIWLTTKDEKIHWHITICGNETSCKICNVKIANTKDDINDHINSEDHELKYKKLLTDNLMKNTGDFTVICDACNKMFLVKEALMHSINKKHKRNMLARRLNVDVSHEIATCEQLTEYEKSMKPVTTPTKLNYIFEMTHDQYLIKCKFCNISIPYSKNNIKIHSKSTYHKNKVKMILASNKMMRNYKGMCYCEICNEIIKIRIEHEHIMSEAHVSKLNSVYTDNHSIESSLGESKGTSEEEYDVDKESIDNNSSIQDESVNSNIFQNQKSDLLSLTLAVADISELENDECIQKTKLEETSGSKTTETEVNVDKTDVLKNIVVDEHDSELKSQWKSKKIEYITDNYCSICDRRITNTDKKSLQKHKGSISHRLKVWLATKDEKIHWHMKLCGGEANCKICDVKVPVAKDAIDDHINSEEHELKYKKMLGDNLIENTSKFIMECGVCNTTCLIKDVISHSQTRKHKKNMLAIGLDAGETREINAFLPKGSNICKKDEAESDICDFTVTADDISCGPENTEFKHIATFKETSDGKETSSNDNNVAAENAYIDKEETIKHIELQDNDLAVGDETNVVKEENNIENDETTINAAVISQNRERVAEIKEIMTELKGDENNHDIKIVEHKTTVDINLPANAGENTQTKDSVEIDDNIECLSSDVYLIEPTKNPKKVLCIICKRKLTNREDIILEHLDSVKHEFKYQSFLLSHRMKEAYSTFVCEVCLVDIEKENLFVHVSSYKHCCNLSEEKMNENAAKNVDIKQLFKQLSISEQRIVDSSHKKYLMQKFDDTAPLLYCKLCDSDVMNTEDYLKDHIVTETHLKRYESLLIENEIKIVDQKKYCLVCKKNVLDLEELDHVYSKNHAKKIKKKEKVKIRNSYFTCSLCEEKVKCQPESMKIHNETEMHKNNLMKLQTGKTLMCDVCNVVLNTRLGWRLHSIEPEHKHKVALRNTTNSKTSASAVKLEGNLTTPKPGPSQSQSMPAIKKEQSSVPAVNLEKNQSAPKPGPSQPQSIPGIKTEQISASAVKPEENKSAPKPGPSQPQSMPAIKKNHRVKSYTCVVCNTTLDNNLNIIIAHYNSKLHKDSAKTFLKQQLEKGTRPCAIFTDISNTPEYKELIAKGNCDVCKCVVPMNPHSVKEHLRGNSHKNCISQNLNKKAENNAAKTGAQNCKTNIADCNISKLNCDPSNGRESVIDTTNEQSKPLIEIKLNRKARKDAESKTNNPATSQIAETSRSESAQNNRNNNGGARIKPAEVIGESKTASNTNLKIARTEKDANINNGNIDIQTNKNELYACNICKVNLPNTEGHIKGHLNGKKHRQKLISYLQNNAVVSIPSSDAIVDTKFNRTSTANNNITYVMKETETSISSNTAKANKTETDTFIAEISNKGYEADGTKLNDIESATKDNLVKYCTKLVKSDTVTLNDPRLCKDVANGSSVNSTLTRQENMKITIKSHKLEILDTQDKTNENSETAEKKVTHNIKQMSEERIEKQQNAIKQCGDTEEQSDADAIPSISESVGDNGKNTEQSVSNKATQLLETVNDASILQSKSNNVNQKLEITSNNKNTEQSKSDGEDTMNEGFYVCDLCEISVKNDPVEIREHLKCYRHQRNLQELKEKQRENSDIPEMYFCAICNVKLERNALNIRVHLESAHHMIKFESTLAKHNIQMKDKVCYCKLCDLYFNKYSVEMHIKRESHVCLLA